MNEIRAIIDSYEQKVKGEIVDKYLNQVYMRKEKAFKCKEQMVKIQKIEEIVKEMEIKGAEVMKSIEAEGINKAIQRLVSETNYK